MGVALARRDTGKRVLVVGAGPSGLSVAYHLRQLGHQVHLVDASEKLGGMMRYGIPRVPTPSRRAGRRDQPHHRSRRGRCRLNHTVHGHRTRATRGRLRRPCSSASAPSWLAAWRSPRATPRGILDAVSYLHQVADDNVPSRARVVVYGGGDTRWMRHAPLVVWMRPTRSLSIAEAANRCPPIVELEEALKRAITCVGSRPSATSRVTT